jgi:uncharacterized membrane protein
MDKAIRRYAWVFAILVFFVMAVAGWFSHGDPAVCAWRGLMGGIVMYTVVRIAGAALLHILIETAVQEEVKKNNQEPNRS